MLSVASPSVVGCSELYSVVIRRQWDFLSPYVLLYLSLWLLW